MDDTISRQAAIDALKHDAKVLGIEPYDQGYTPFDAIITCREFRWRNDYGHWLGCPVLNVDGDNYCNYAERRNDG